VELDYTPETLSLVDYYMERARENVTERPELLEVVTRSVGAYFGEVVRRTFHGFWRLPSGDAHDWQVCMQEVYLAINPIGVAWDAVRASAEHEGPSSELVLDRDEVETVERRLAALPEVPEDQYWLLTTRIEVIEVAVEHLRVEMERGGIADVSFEPGDYDIAPRALGQA